MIAGLMYREESHLSDVGVHARGEVIRVDEEADDDGTSTFPIVQFDTGREHLYELRSHTSSSDEVGDYLDVIYDPEAPGDSAEIDRFSERWLLVTVFALVSFGGLVAAWMCGEPAPADTLEPVDA